MSGFGVPTMELLFSFSLVISVLLLEDIAAAKTLPRRNTTRNLGARKRPKRALDQQ